MKTIYFATLLYAVTSLPAVALACDAAGEQTHIGQVLSTNGNEFTIRDAQSGGPIHFTSNDKMQGKLPSVGDRIAVNYSKGEHGLVAESVR